MNNSRNLVYTIVGIAVVLVLIGAYLLFQKNPAALAPVETATSTETATTTPATTTPATAPTVNSNPLSPAGSGAGTPVITPATSSFDLSITVSTTTVGATLPTFAVKVPPGSQNKVLEIGLKPATSTNALPEEVLLLVAVNTSGTNYPISGLRLSVYTDAKTGQKANVTPGTYELEAILWDHNPLTVNGTYGDFSGNNATAVLSAPFTITP